MSRVFFKSNAAQIKQQMLAQNRHAVTARADDLEKEIGAEMEAPKHGREYQRAGRSHTAAAPGSPAASDSGEMLRSFQTTVETDAHATSATVGTNEPHALVQEFGGVHTPAPPVVGPALQHVAPDFERRLREGE